jgi:hypothetical protein
MLNTHFEQAAKAVKSLNTKTNGMYGHLLAFAHEHRTNGADALRDHFKAQEKLATLHVKVEMGKNSTYKVAKGKLIKAVELGIALVDADGKPIGKTALEEAIKGVEGASAEAEDKKAPATPFDQFTLALATASDAAKSIPDTDIAMAAGQVQVLLEALVKRIPVAKAA